MPQPPPVLCPPLNRMATGPTMQAATALRAGGRSLLAHPAAAILGLVPLVPLAAISILKTAFPHPAFSVACSCANFLLLGPAIIGCWRHYLVLIDGSQPAPSDWLMGLPFFLPTLFANILRTLAVAMLAIPTVLILTIYLLLSASNLTKTGAPSPRDFVVFMVVASPAAIGIVGIKCLTYPFEILLADGRASRLGPCLNAAIHLAWRNMKPIAWIFTTIGLVAILLFALAYLATPLLHYPSPSSNFAPAGPLADSLPAIQAIGQAAQLSIIPILPWIFLTLTHAHRQAMPAAARPAIIPKPTENQT